MKALIFVIVLATSATAANAQYRNNNNSYGSGMYGTGSNTRSHTVQPSINSQGTYTQGHRATSPNNTQFDNYGTRGNVNPYTGQVGTRAPRY